mmetsp:Transcript_25571/g.63856  ORF Transcript_25571/g.63856 Transcript_25571/m.63856 type:complete len:80 (-) Transcript_25571:152-391(-)|eukprot:CAMPEP_0184726530 /NCGR_PEP_ID=MMETSP0314-20130426/33971_1 /TAXON_ID=38298 /ORGANISM="Rhodella maculata, Strain CCMP 736" /LENGTH=79 /DNA_ID=CAMNT_0027191957 /DNA_START=106 /DNA_END=345 /DNA_ORIENTATION=+
MPSLENFIDSKDKTGRILLIQLSLISCEWDAKNLSANRSPVSVRPERFPKSAVWSKGWTRARHGLSAIEEASENEEFEQ